MPCLGPDCDLGKAWFFVERHRKACLEELVAHGGMDQVRAGLLRTLVMMVEDVGEREAILKQVDDVLQGFQGAIEREGPALMIRRHPAWVGLCAYEVAVLRSAGPGACLQSAVQHAMAGFRRLSIGDTGEGEVIWAMAEQAEDVGWTERSRDLLERASGAEFSQERNHQQVSFLAAMRRIENGDSDVGVLVDIARHVATPVRTRVHALWVAGQVYRAADDTALARQMFEEAAAMVDIESDPEVAGRIASALAEL